VNRRMRRLGLSVDVNPNFHCSAWCVGRTGDGFCLVAFGSDQWLMKHQQWNSDYES
jgi:hypothetical protein